MRYFSVHGVCCVWRLYALHFTTGRETYCEADEPLILSFYNSISWEIKRFCFRSLYIICCTMPNRVGQISRWYHEHLPSDRAPLGLAGAFLVMKHRLRGSSKDWVLCWSAGCPFWGTFSKVWPMFPLQRAVQWDFSLAKWGRFVHTLGLVHVVLKTCLSLTSCYCAIGSHN